ncbi:hypothetical protein KOW79_014399 [Hemibagrus wyckioides]|uniref:Histone-lysine N-methyltransferase PRDM9 n=1 Tax=Hemibagrus wyckioides TaxID=337641 RepID=A0A9D3NF46_9TELE|nr:hypothetical protein KOW79_014399 [Hemibagrus wyckioides]
MFEFCFKNPDINTFRRLIMEPEDVKDSSLGKTAHTAAPAASQLNEDTSAGETTNCEGNITIEDQQKVVKKEEPEDDGYLYGEISETNVTSVEQSDEEILKTVKEEEPEQDEYLGGGTSVSVRRVVIVDENSEVFQSKPIKEEEPEDDDYLYCEDCRSFFIGECEVHGPVLFIQDTPVPMGVADRAKQTLPQGLEILKSSISDLGVFNKGDTVPVGVHFGPYQGDLVDREEAMKSVYSWVVYKNMQCEEYIDAKRETHANWMRYVNCAPNSEEKNLMAYQYQGGILYRCCQAIKPGQELLVWYEEEYAKHLGVTFDYLWNKKSTNGNEMKSFPLQVFSCSSCSFSYTSQIYLHKHIKRCHNEEYVRLLKCDVRDCLIAENASGFLCDDRVTCVPASGLCNGMSSCPDGADEDRLMCMMDVFNADPMVRCGNPRVWIFADQKCNHMNDCGDCSDEVYASCPPCAGDWWSCDPTEFHFCSCVPRYFCNDGRHHCSDEHICPKT